MDLAEASKSPPGQVLAPFFLQIKQKDKLDELAAETKTFAQKIKARAVEKRKETTEEAQGRACLFRDWWLKVFISSLLRGRRPGGDWGKVSMKRCTVAITM